jgi:hypothetical protein
MAAAAARYMAASRVWGGVGWGGGFLELGLSCGVWGWGFCGGWGFWKLRSYGKATGGVCWWRKGEKGICGIQAVCAQIVWSLVLARWQMVNSFERHRFFFGEFLFFLL